MELRLLCLFASALTIVSGTSIPIPVSVVDVNPIAADVRKAAVEIRPEALPVPLPVPAPVAKLIPTPVPAEVEVKSETVLPMLQAPTAKSNLTPEPADVITLTRDPSGPGIYRTESGEKVRLSRVGGGRSNPAPPAFRREPMPMRFPMPDPAFLRELLERTQGPAPAPPAPELRRSGAAGKRRSSLGGPLPLMDNYRSAGLESSESRPSPASPRLFDGLLGGYYGSGYYGGYYDPYYGTYAYPYGSYSYGYPTYY